MVATAGSRAGQADSPIRASRATFRRVRGGSRRPPAGVPLVRRGDRRSKSAIELARCLVERPGRAIGIQTGLRKAVCDALILIRH